MIFGTETEREVKRMQPLVDAVRAEGQRIQFLTNDQLRAKTGEFKTRLAQGATLDDLLVEAFAVAREASKRVIGLRPFDVQIMGGAILHNSGIAEMVTGEGKTLVAVLPCYLNALTGRGVHVVTVNDYLARRDSDWMRPIFEFLGLTVGLIQHDMYDFERKVSYRADITYGTNNELGFDYLRDNMAKHPDRRVQRELNYAIVDEVDSILIDEARTPLIISGRPEKSSDLYLKVDAVARQLRKEKHFELEEKGHHVLFTEDGMEAAERMLGVEDLFSNDSLGMVHMLEQAMKAHHFFKRDKDYMVDESEVLIIDEFTGRTMEGRRYSDGLHQALEAKEQVPLKFESQTVASITYQNYFRLYNKLAGMTGTALTEAVEFQKVYRLDVVQIPTNLPLIREDLTDLIFRTEDGKFRYVIDQIKEINQTGRPILVGTVSIEKSEQVAKLLMEAGVTDFQVLNAKHHEREASIVANAGKRGAITIATNMAGRGTDIKLAEGIRELGGLYIIGTERHESRRIDNQLRGRAGRQGDPGTTRFFVSLEDEVARLFGGDKVKRLIDIFGGEELDTEPLSQRMVTRTIERAQRQVEEHNFEIRKHVLEYDEVMDKQRKYIYALRKEVLEDRDVTGRLHQMIEDAIADQVEEYAAPGSNEDDWDLDSLQGVLKRLFNMELDVEPEEEGADLVPFLKNQVLKEYERREACEAELLRGYLKQRYEGDVERIDIAATARKQFHIFELSAILDAVDEKWINHLYEMDYLRESVRLRAFGQRDPLLEYKQEGFQMFQALIRNIEENVLTALFRVTDPDVLQRRLSSQKQDAFSQPEADQFRRLAEYQEIGADKQADHSFSAFDTSRFKLAGQADRAELGPRPHDQEKEKPKRAPVKVIPKAGPNDPCPCGSGKKFKKCCGRANE
ncbi:MAG: preprotein translocase subunit SecA [Candidatus Hydrogenedentes bacterium]|nr:preprotein translocase subunit SecA [Candidatus Hydrogenedentota bacterium]